MKRTASERINELSYRLERIASATKKLTVICTDFPRGAKEDSIDTKYVLTHREVANMVLKEGFDVATIEDREVTFTRRSFFSGINYITVKTNEGRSLVENIQRAVSRKGGETINVRDWSSR